jgi:hypothetical protein
MTRWEIRIAEQPPIHVEVEDDTRDLAAEFRAHQARRKRREADYWWQPTEGAGVTSRIVIAVRRRRLKRNGTMVSGFRR